MFRKLLTTLLLIAVTAALHAQTDRLRPKRITKLAPQLEETSGLAWANGQLWTHNDSGDDPIIYRVDPENGAVLQSIRISNAKHVDWEDITSDDSYLYVADTGNNYRGNRRDLTIYKIALSELKETTTELTAELIEFAYEDQTDFSAQPGRKTSYDCETLIAHNGQLHLFTKDWAKQYTAHYTLPVTPGQYKAKKVNDYFCDCLVTGGDVAADGTFGLLSYTRKGKISVWLIRDYPPGNPLAGTVQKIKLGNSAFKGQTEAFLFVEKDEPLLAWTSSERFKKSIFKVRESLWRLRLGKCVD